MHPDREALIQKMLVEIHATSDDIVAIVLIFLKEYIRDKPTIIISSGL